jgi:hypothetical protein
LKHEDFRALALAVFKTFDWEEGGKIKVCVGSSPEYGGSISFRMTATQLYFRVIRYPSMEDLYIMINDVPYLAKSEEDLEEVRKTICRFLLEIRNRTLQHEKEAREQRESIENNVGIYIISDKLFDKPLE